MTNWRRIEGCADLRKELPWADGEAAFREAMRVLERFGFVRKISINKEGRVTGLEVRND